MVFIYIIKLLQRSGKRFEKASLFLTRGRLIFSEASLINSQIRSFRAPPLVSKAYLQRSSKRFEKASLFLTRGRLIFSEASLINSQIRSFRAPPLVSQAYLLVKKPRKPNACFAVAWFSLRLLTSLPRICCRMRLPPGLLHHSVGSMLRPASGQPRPSDQRSHLKVS